MRTKNIAVLLLLVTVSFSWIAIVEAPPQENTKKGFNVDVSDLVSRTKPSKPPGGGGKPSGDISTGTVADFSGDRFAIIIGISDYAGTVNDLDYCDDDAADFKKALPNSYTVIELLDDDATRQAILDAIESVGSQVTADDEVVFFYSGHGSVSSANPDGDSERKDECIIPWEATFASAIWDGELTQAFSDFTCRIMFYFDSCYSGGMTDLAAPNRLICMACGESQLSLESNTWENGQFSYYFADEGLLQGLADKNGDALVTFEEAFDYAKANCIRQTPTAVDSFVNDMAP